MWPFDSEEEEESCDHDWNRESHWAEHGRFEGIDFNEDNSFEIVIQGKKEYVETCSKCGEKRDWSQYKELGRVDGRRTD